MDILLRLKVLLWSLVLTLWGLMLFHFMAEGPEAPSVQRLRAIPNPFREAADPGDPAIEAPADFGARLARLFPAKPPDPGPRPLLPPPQPESPAALTPPLPEPGRVAATTPTAAPPRRPRLEPRPRPPPGFVRTDTAHFQIFYEGEQVPASLAKTAEYLHANLMLDLAAFSPWAASERVNLYIFRSQDSYRRVTGRPSWSGGASSVLKRRIFIYESEEFTGILAHELCHIYFDSFFNQPGGPPLWLSEGMATLIQVEKGLAAPQWLREHLDILRRGGGFKLPELLRISDTSNSPDAKVRLWYAQSYSLTRFLTRSRYRSSFYKFCRGLSKGLPLEKALLDAYGLPFNRVQSLEYAWRYDIHNRPITRLTD